MVNREPLFCLPLSSLPSFITFADPFSFHPALLPLPFPLRWLSFSLSLPFFAKPCSFCSFPLLPTSCSRLVRERKSTRSWDRFSAQQEAPPTMTAILQPALVSLYHITLHCIVLAYLCPAMRSHPWTISPWFPMGISFAMFMRTDTLLSRNTRSIRRQHYVNESQ